MEIIIPNIIFWTAWIGLSYLPQWIFQKMIDNYGDV